MGLNMKIGRSIAAYSLIVGLFYLVFGLLELVNGLSQTFGLKWAITAVNPAIVSPDIFSGVTLAIIGLIFLFGVRPQWMANKDAASYLAVGTLLATVFFAVYLAIMGSHAVGWGVYHIAPEPYADIFADWAEWIWLDDLRPGIWLFALAVPGLYYTLKMWLSRKKNP
ncbi:MAG: hypothetical protein NWF05_09015 [Candidatus Bathyarchaeota archaeon]|nr:hypothetical protein [Candidatus Bathyarchaeota archaeon]